MGADIVVREGNFLRAGQRRSQSVAALELLYRTCVQDKGLSGGHKMNYSKIGIPRSITNTVGARAVPTACTNPVVGAVVESAVPLRNTRSPTVHVQAPLVTSPDSITAPLNPIAMALGATPMILPKAALGLALSATRPLLVTTAKAGMSSAATTVSCPVAASMSWSDLAVIINAMRSPTRMVRAVVLSCARTIVSASPKILVTRTISALLRVAAASAGNTVALNGGAGKTLPSPVVTCNPVPDAGGACGIVSVEKIKLAGAVEITAFFPCSTAHLL